MKHPFTRPIIRKKPTITSSVADSRKGLSFVQQIVLVLLASIGLLAASGWYWYSNVLTDPNRIMSDALDKSLQTTSVYRTVEQKGNQNNIKQSLYLSFTPNTVAKSITDLKETGATGNSSVTTETIGTKDTDYIRYNAIDISSRNTPKQDFSNIIKTWGKRQATVESTQPVSFLNDALFVAVPFGNLNEDQRRQLKAEIVKVNLYETTKTETKMQNGRPVMLYSVEISPKALVQVLAKYVELTGVGSTADLDPAQYEGASSTPITIEVDMLSRHINKIDFAESGRTEVYGGYNMRQEVAIPTQTIEIDELQKRLSEIEQKMQQSSQQ